MSFKPEVSTGSDPKFYSNALRFATREEAEARAMDLAMRWTAVRNWRAVESDDPVNYAIRDGLLVRIEEKGL